MPTYPEVEAAASRLLCSGYLGPTWLLVSRAPGACLPVSSGSWPPSQLQPRHHPGTHLFLPPCISLEALRGEDSPKVPGRELSAGWQVGTNEDRNQTTLVQALVCQLRGLLSVQARTSPAVEPA